MFFIDVIIILFTFNISLFSTGSEEGGLPMKSSSRPEWCMIAKVNQNMETVLFKEKFSDWPDATKLIRGDAEEAKVSFEFDVQLA